MLQVPLMSPGRSLGAGGTARPRSLPSIRWVPSRPGLAPMAGACAVLLALALPLSGGAQDPGVPGGSNVGPPPGLDGDWERLAERVEIRRTERGIPHVVAEDLEAAGFGLAWVQLEDYGIQVVNRLLSSRGDRARHYRGASATSDARSRRSRRRAGEVFPELPDDLQAVYKGFAAGVNRFLELHPEDAPPSLRPDFTPEDILARDVNGAGWGTAARFRGELEAHFEEAEGDGRYGDDPTGSNTWALAPSRTESGNAILMRNPHLSWTAGYYEAQLIVEGEFSFYGDFRIGGPFSTIGGWNEYLGWSTTNNNPERHDIYVLAADPEREDHVLFGGESVPLEKHEIPVEVLGDDGVEEEIHEQWESPVGPVIQRAPGSVYALRSGGDLEYRGGEQLLRKMQATNLEEWRDAMRLPGRTGSNYAYADRDGNILLVWNALHPDRPHPHGADTLAIPAAGPEDVWQDYIPFDALPQVLNPEGGYVRNENDPFYHTNLNEVLHPEDFPAEFPDPRLRLRSQHSLEILDNDRVFSLEDVVEKKHSLRMLLADRVLPDLLEALREAGVAEGGSGDEALADAVATLEEWDGTVARDARGAVLFTEWWDRYLEGAERVTPAPPDAAGFPADGASLFAEPWDFDRPLETPRGLADPQRAVDAFRRAVTATRDRWGAVDVAWGDMHRARHGRLDVPAAGCDGALGCFRIFWFTSGGDGRRQVRGGDGWVSAVEFGDVPRAYTTLAYGQSARPDSPHHEDQLEAFAEGRMTPVSFTEEDIQGALLERYRPGEGERWTREGFRR